MSEIIRALFAKLARSAIADDHHVVRRGLATLLVPRCKMTVVDEATNGARPSSWRSHCGSR
jgi:DNA-binding NarL/FixJ family response regulator